MNSPLCFFVHNSLSSHAILLARLHIVPITTMMTANESAGLILEMQRLYEGSIRVIID